MSKKILFFLDAFLVIFLCSYALYLTYNHNIGFHQVGVGIGGLILVSIYNFLSIRKIELNTSALAEYKRESLLLEVNKKTLDEIVKHNAYVSKLIIDQAELLTTITGIAMEQRPNKKDHNIQ